jgi:hypothetical protein
MVEGFQEYDTQVASSSDEDSVEFDILNNGADNQWVLTRLWDEVWVVASVKGDGDLGPLQVLGVAGDTTMTSEAVSFCFLIDS